MRARNYIAVDAVMWYVGCDRQFLALSVFTHKKRLEDRSLKVYVFPRIAYVPCYVPYFGGKKGFLFFLVIVHLCGYILNSGNVVHLE